MTLENWMRERLKQALLEMRKQNPRTSIRSLARKLDIPAGTVNLLLLGKRSVSAKLAEKLSQALALDPMERKKVDTLLNEKKAASSRTRKSESPHSVNRVLEKVYRPSVLRLSGEQFADISEWYYFGILSLLKTRDFSEDPRWIGKRLGIHSSIAQAAFGKLLEMGLIVRGPNGKPKRGYDVIRTIDQIPQKSIRKSHEENIRLAKKALNEGVFEQCDFTSINLPVTFSRLNDIKLKIRRFQEEMIAEFAYDSQPDEVIRLASFLFPVTVREEASS